MEFIAVILRNFTQDEIRGELIKTLKIEISSASMSGFCQYLPNKICKTPAPKKSRAKATSAPKGKSFITESAPVDRRNHNKKETRPKEAKKDDEIVPISAVAPNGDDYDLFRIDKHIRQTLVKRMSSLSTMKKDLETLLWISEHGNDNLDRVQAKKETSILRRRICDIECGFELGLYFIQTTDLLRQYREIVNTQKNRSFVVDSSSKSLVSSSVKENLIAEFLRIARDYVEIDGFLARIRKMTCPACGGSNFTCEEEDTMYTCTNVECGSVLNLLSDAPTFKDTDRVNMAARYTYSCRTHFIDAMNHFEGIQNTEIKPEILTTLYREMENHSLTAKTVTKDHLYMFLSENQLSSHYEDLNLLYKLITGVPPPTISEYRTELLDMFQQVEDTYPEIKDPERVNSMNVNFKLYKLLQLIDYPCRKDDFYILKTPTKLGEHDEKWNELIDALMKKYPKAMTTKGKKRWRHTRTI